MRNKKLVTNVGADLIFHYKVNKNSKILIQKKRMKPTLLSLKGKTIRLYLGQTKNNSYSEF